MTDQSRSASQPAPGPSPSAHGEPSGPDAVLYQERLTPAWWMWLLHLGLAGAVAIALAPLSLALGITAGVLVFAAAVVVAQVRAPSIVVTTDMLTVGRASIERRFVGQAEAITDPEAVRRARGPELDARAYMRFSASVGSIARIEIIDPVDPTPYWLAATRHPHDLVRALES